MHNKQIGCVALLLLAAMVLTSCGSETSDSSGSAKDADRTSTPTPTPSPTESEPSGPPPSGTLATKPVPCKKFTAPAGFKQAGAMPPVMCAFESKDARVTVSVAGGPVSFADLQQFEELAARSKGVTPPALEHVTLDGWTFAAIWPELGGFNRMERYLVDSAGNALACRVGVQSGKVDATTHADFCDSVRGVLHKP